ncbi:MAG: TonB-dependent receptor [Prevotellaceae bacterium]|nr:TonB-dependent receptor [Prevotellaceae bacterium]
MRKTFSKSCMNSLLCKVAMTVLLLFPAMNFLHAGSLSAKTVTGKVLSATDNEPLIGATVAVEGRQGGVITDIDGNFSISANDGETLVISYIGFVTQKVKVSGATLNVTLVEESNSLEDVVVIGYGVQKKKLVTGATLQVKGDDISKMNTTNPLQAMQGQTPGMTISSTSGQPGSDMKVTIRGLGTVGTSTPLYIIDGIRGDISTVNPSDIESIDVLKDAASAAIYGSQSANGVVLVTTKSGKEGRAIVSFDGYYGWQNKARSIDMLNAQEYMMIMDEAAVNSGKTVYDWSSYKSIYDANGNVYDTDWVDQMFKDNAVTQGYNVGVTGGSAKVTYAMNLGYTSQEGIVGGKDVSNYERYNFRVNSEWKMKDWLKVGEQVSFSYTKNNGIAVGNQYSNTLRSAFQVSPIVPVYSDNNIYDSPYNDTTNSDWYTGDGNPYGSMMTSNQNQTKNAALSTNVYAEIEPIKNLKFRSVLGVLYNSSDYRSYTPLYQFSPYSYNSTTSVSQNKNDSFGITWTNTLSYDWKIKEHSFNALVGYEVYRTEGSYLSAGQTGLRTGFDSWSYAYVHNGTALESPGLSADGTPNDEEKMISYFARVGWNWKETYLLNATIRRDGSSRFAKGNRFGWFPSVSVGWIITNEKWAEPVLKVMDYFKLRASWGQVGNQSIGNYQYTAPVTYDYVYYNFGTGLGSTAQSNGAYPSRIANEDITWETSEQFDIGFDARFLDGRLGANFDFYTKTTKDWLVVAPILATVGTGAPYINGGDVKNTGIEVGLNWNDNIGKDFTYNVGFNISYNKNKVGNIPNEDGIIHGSTNMLYDNSPEFYRASNGEPIGYFWGYKTAGIFQSWDDINEWIAAGNGVLQADVQPGDVKYYDVNHDGAITEDDKVNLGNGMPDVTYGFNIGFTWKNLDFSLTANGQAGNEIVQSYRNTSTTQNYTTEILSRWTGEGTSNRIPRVTQTNINWLFSDLYIHDGDFLRISNITLGYDFSKLFKNCGFSQLRVYAQVQNAFTFTKYNGMDPEIGYGMDGWVSGVDLGYYPRPRTILFGVNMKF